jgi:hypothetical protein
VGVGIQRGQLIGLAAVDADDGAGVPRAKVRQINLRRPEQREVKPLGVCQLSGVCFSAAAWLIVNDITLAR